MNSKLLAAFTIVLVVSGCIDLFGPGAVTLVKCVLNPAKSKRAIMFVNDGNASTNSSYHISIKDTNSGLRDVKVGNTFICDFANGNAKIDSTTVKIDWLADDRLQITYDQQLRTFKMEHVVNGVEVIYKAF